MIHHRFMHRIVALLALVGLGVTLAPQKASAGGLFLTDRGVRAAGRGFAYVAGVDDPHALWYNPANLRMSGQQLLFDFTMTHFRADFTRIDGGGNTLPTVDASAPLLPIPTLAYTHSYGDFGFGIGIEAPNAIPLSWPNGITADGQECDPHPDNPGCEAAPTRYSLYSLDGSAFASISPGVSWEPIKGLHFGVGMHLMFGAFTGETAISGCDGGLCTQPENPEWDGRVRFNLSPIVEPGLSAGVTYDGGVFRVGASLLWWPKAVSGDAELDIRLPSSTLFDGATVDGNEARLELQLPLTVRFGVEVRPLRNLRIEAAVVWERWSSQVAAKIQPKNIWIRNVIAIGDYQAGDIEIPRNMNDVISIRLGGEYGLMDDRLWLRAGVNYESDSFDNAYLTPLTLDSSKWIVGIGAAYEATDNFFIDVNYAHIFMDDPQVRDSAVPQPNPIRPPRDPNLPPNQSGVSPVGNGDYNMEADMFGIGIRYQWGGDDEEEPLEGEAEPTPAEANDPV